MGMFPAFSTDSLGRTPVATDATLGPFVKVQSINPAFALLASSIPCSFCESAAISNAIRSKRALWAKPRNGFGAAPGNVPEPLMSFCRWMKARCRCHPVGSQSLTLNTTWRREISQSQHSAESPAPVLRVSVAALRRGQTPMTGRMFGVNGALFQKREYSAPITTTRQAPVRGFSPENHTLIVDGEAKLYEINTGV